MDPSVDEPEPRPVLPADAMIPDFCRGPALLKLAFIMELVAIVLTLASTPLDTDPLERLLLLSLFLQWIGLCSGAALCLSRRWLRIANPGLVFALCWILLVAITVVISDLAYYIAVHFLDPRIAPSEGRQAFIIRHLCISAIVSLLLLRYFWAQNRWRGQVRAEGEARYQALHARIRPHFLFNALNSLAALIAIKPQAAEAMVEDLADLFRVSLEARQRLVPLSEELDLVRTYMRIEQTRLGARLGMEWDVPEHFMSLPVPLLTIQPLVENAVYHGVAKMTGAASIRVAVSGDDHQVVIAVENPVPPSDAAASHGSQHAVGNIAERLRLIYGDRAALELTQADGIYRAQLKLPWIKEASKEDSA
mgnify:CR=1 FL=1